MGGKIDLEKVPYKSGSSYPKRFQQVRGDIAAKRWQGVGDAAGLTVFGVNRMVMEPGAASSLRHWHTHEDEFVVVLEGELVMVTDEGETTMRAGDMVGFPKGVENGHCFVNRSEAVAVFLAIGNRSEDDECFYVDVDMRARSERQGGGYVSRAGEPYVD
jgi:uncharacterized cupin superfamily protein